MSTETMIRVFQGTADASDDGWANDAYYALQNGGVTVDADAEESWDECSGRQDGEEYVEMRVTDVPAALARLAECGFRGEVATA